MMYRRWVILGGRKVGREGVRKGGCGQPGTRTCGTTEMQRVSAQREGGRLEAGSCVGVRIRPAATSCECFVMSAFFQDFAYQLL